MALLYFALGFFIIGALFGLAMAVKVLNYEHPPIWVAVTHGVFAATGLLLLLIASQRNGAPAMSKAIGAAFVLAAFGGFYLASFHARGKTHPIPVLLLHATLALSGAILLSVTVIQFQNM